MKKNYCNNAANWWATKIKNSVGDAPIRGLELFTESLAKQIEKLTSINGYLIISTYESSSNLLDKIAIHSGLTAKIPSGYEMRIFFNYVCVYDSSGMLVNNF